MTVYYKLGDTVSEERYVVAANGHGTGRWRPVAVIDPTDDESTSRLWRLLPDNLVSIDQLQAALREFAAPTPRPADVVAALIHEYAVERGDLSEQYARDQLRNKIMAAVAPTPPRPEEPQGLGAVVVDDNAVTYVRAGRLSPDGFDLRDCWRAVDGPVVGDWKRWDRINVVRKLSDGVEA